MSVQSHYMIYMSSLPGILKIKLLLKVGDPRGGLSTGFDDLTGFTSFLSSFFSWELNFSLSFPL